jgi:hypothetical protein
MSLALSPEERDLLALHLVPGLGPRLTSALLKREKRQKPQEIRGFRRFHYTSCPSLTLQTGVVGCSQRWGFVGVTHKPSFPNSSAC